MCYKNVKLLATLVVICQQLVNTSAVLQELASRNICILTGLAFFFVALPPFFNKFVHIDYATKIKLKFSFLFPFD